MCCAKIGVKAHAMVLDALAKEPEKNEKREPVRRLCLNGSETVMQLETLPNGLDLGMYRL